MRNKLRQLVSQFFDSDPETIDSQLPLTGPRMQGSIARYSLDAVIRRRLGMTCPAVYTATTYGELEAGVLGLEAQSPPASVALAPSTAPALPAVPVPATMPSGLACGVDIELIDALPEATDYWSH